MAGDRKFIRATCDVTGLKAGDLHHKQNFSPSFLHGPFIRAERAEKRYVVASRDKYIKIDISLVKYIIIHQRIRSSSHTQTVKSNQIYFKPNNQTYNGCHYLLYWSCMPLSFIMFAYSLDLPRNRSRSTCHCKRNCYCHHGHRQWCRCILQRSHQLLDVCFLLVIVLIGSCGSCGGGRSRRVGATY